MISVPIVAQRGQTLLIVQLVCIYIALTITALRVLSKHRVGADGGRGHMREDLIMYFAAAMYVVLAGVDLPGIVLGGIGKHAKDITVAEAAVAFRAWFICELLYAPLSAAIRTSIALVLLRLNPPRQLRYALYGCLAIMYVFTVIYFVLNLLQCSPPSYFWRQFIDLDSPGSCSHPHYVPSAAIAHSALSAASDWFIAVCCVLLLSRSSMGKWRRTAMMVFLALGATAGAVMIIRIPFIKLLEINPDFLYRTVDVAMWSIIEPCVGIIAGSLPFVRILFMKRPEPMSTDRQICVEMSCSVESSPCESSPSGSSHWSRHEGSQNYSVHINAQLI